ncbi:MAG TPA: hypothetical protein VGI51_07220 [Steroidobacteraceae bacterium]
MTEQLQLYEVALAREEVDEILVRCGVEALLVGGQALAIWAEYFRVEPVRELSEKVTLDVDFIGTRQVAEKLRVALGWNIYFPSIEDATSQTAKVATTLPGGGVKQVDFLNAIVGLDTAKVQSRAAELELRSGIRIRILHPLDVLESRLRNLDILPAKRNSVGIAQAALAIAVAGQFFNLLLESGEPMRIQLDAVKRITQIAFDLRLSRVAFDFGLNPLASVPWLRINSPAFQSKRWPQILARAEELNRKHADREARRLARRSRK